MTHFCVAKTTNKLFWSFFKPLPKKKRKKKTTTKKNPSEGGNLCKSKKGLSPKLNTDQTQSPDAGQWLYTELLNHALMLHHIYI